MLRWLSTLLWMTLAAIVGVFVGSFFSGFVYFLGAMTGYAFIDKLVPLVSVGSLAIGAVLGLTLSLAGVLPGCSRKLKNELLLRQLSIFLWTTLTAVLGTVGACFIAIFAYS